MHVAGGALLDTTALQNSITEVKHFIVMRILSALKVPDFL
jgi:hypothetical protein